MIGKLYEYSLQHSKCREISWSFVPHFGIRHGALSDPWWRHQMETFSALLALCAGNSPVPGEFPAQRSVTRSFDVFFDLRPNKRLSKQLWNWWIYTPSCPSWRHCNANEGPRTFEGLLYHEQDDFVMFQMTRSTADTAGWERLSKRHLRWHPFDLMPWMHVKILLIAWKLISQRVPMQLCNGTLTLPQITEHVWAELVDG